MGKRSTTSTKSGKFMNPTDQARKEQRKRELKKNKKQRQMVRTAVLKGKNPREIVVELEKIDDMEYSVVAPPPLNEKVLRDKRRKLVETWQRVIELYRKEEPDQIGELKKIWTMYQGRKAEVIQRYDSVKNAQNVQVDDIPLPEFAVAAAAAAAAALPLLDGDDLEGDGGDGRGGEDEDHVVGAESTDEIPLPPSGITPAYTPPSILKKPATVVAASNAAAVAAAAALSYREVVRYYTVCPGVPSCPPPLLQEYADGEDDDEAVGEDSAVSAAADRPRKIRFADAPESAADAPAPGSEPSSSTRARVDDVQRKMLAMAGQDVDHYIKEMEEVHRQTQVDKQAQIHSRLSTLEEQEPGPPGDSSGPPGLMTLTMPTGAPHRGAPGASLPPGPPPPAAMRHPLQPSVVLRPGVPPPGVRLPPGPPPGRPPPAPPGAPSGRPPRLMPPGGLVPPGPPPGAPPRRALMNRPLGADRQSVLIAAPQLNRPDPGAMDARVSNAAAAAAAAANAVKADATGSGVIEAKPKMRSLKSEITRFVPTHIKLKRGESAAGGGGGRKKPTDPLMDVFGKPSSAHQPRQAPLAAGAGAGKDDAYAQFMKEIQGM